MKKLIVAAFILGVTFPFGGLAYASRASERCIPIGHFGNWHGVGYEGQRIVGPIGPQRTFKYQAQNDCISWLGRDN